MKYLLDVNALLAWHHAGSPHHAAFHAWKKTHPASELATTALVELGFLRVSMQVFGYTRAQATMALASIKRDVGHFLATAPSPELPAWAARPAQTTDAYLTQLAESNGCRLATFDAGIPGPCERIAG